MCNANPGSQRSRWPVSDGISFSGFSHLLVGRRDGLQALFWAITVNLILFGLFLICATSVYDTNDDLVMQLIASGFYTGHPDAHLIFTNILIGWILRFLYATWAGHNWYLIYLFAVHYASLTAIAFLVVSRRGGWLCAFLYLGFFLIAETYMLLRLQFTTTAFMAGTAGLLLLMDSLQPEHPARWPRIIFGFGLWSLMCLVREPVAPFLAAVACPFLLERFGWSGWRRLAGAGMVCAAILLVFHEVNRWAYQSDPAWAEYSEYNRLRGEIQNMVPANYIPQADSAVGWSRNDGWMFSEFYFSEPDVYAGAHRMRLLFDRLTVLAQAGPRSSWSGMPAGFLFLPEDFQHTAATLMVLAILNAIGCVFAAGAFRYRCLVALLISYGLCLALTYYLLATAHLPERVSYNIPLFILAICLFWVTGFRGKPPNGRFDAFVDRLRRAVVSKWALLMAIPAWAAWRRPMMSCRRILAVTLIVVWAALYVFTLFELAGSLWQSNASNQNLEQTSRKIIRPISALMPGKGPPVFIIMPADSVLEQCLVFYPSVEKVPFFMVPSGWISHSPIFSQTLERHHLRPYSLSLLDRPDIFFLMQRRWLDPLKLFYQEHYGLNVRFDMVLNTDGMPAFDDCRLRLFQAHVVGSARSHTTSVAN